MRKCIFSDRARLAVKKRRILNPTPSHPSAVRASAVRRGEAPFRNIKICRSRLAFMHKDCRAQASLPRRRSRPQQRGDATRPFFPLKKGKTLKKAEKAFDFSLNACKLYFGIDFLTFQGPVSELITSVISAKVYVNPPSFYIALLLRCLNDQHRKIVSSCLAGRFLYRHLSRFLAGPT